MTKHHGNGGRIASQKTLNQVQMMKLALDLLLFLSFTPRLSGVIVSGPFRTRFKRPTIARKSEAGPIRSRPRESPSRLQELRNNVPRYIYLLQSVDHPTQRYIGSTADLSAARKAQFRRLTPPRQISRLDHRHLHPIRRRRPGKRLRAVSWKRTTKVGECIVRERAC